MRIPLSTLLFLLSPNEEYESRNIDFLSQYEGIKILEANMIGEEGNPSFLYMIPSSLFLRNKESGKLRMHTNVSMVCVKGDTFATLEDFNPKDSVLILDTPNTTSHMFNRISDVFDGVNKWNHDIHEALIRDTSMQELMDITKTYIDHDAVILDKSFSVLAFWKNPDGDSDPYIKDIIENGYVSAEVMSFFRKNNLFSVTKPAKNPMLFQTRLVDGTDLFLLQYTFTINGNVVGYAISMDRDQKPKSNVIDTVGVISSTLGLYFQKESYTKQGITEVYETILNDILNTDQPKQEHFTDKISYINDLTLEGKFWLLRVDYENQGEIPYFFLSWYIRNSVAHMKPFVYRNHLYVLYLGKSNSITLSNEDRVNFVKGFRGTPFSVSISQMFFSLMDLKRAVWQCDEAYRFVNYDFQTCNAFWYKDIYLRSLLEKLIDSGMAENYMSPEYEILRQYDSEHNTDLCEVYMRYLENGRNVNQTANAIFLHRNTVLNKIKKANSILLGDCEDYQTMIAYMLTYIKERM